MIYTSDSTYELQQKQAAPIPPLDRYENDMHPLRCAECGSTGSLKHILWGVFTCDNPNCDSKTIRQ